MAERANVSDLDGIRLFRAVLVKFIESSNTALTDSEGEITRKISWLESEQDAFWVAQVRKCTEAVARARDAVRQKRIFKDSTGRPQSAVDEEKQLKIWQGRLLEAETKLANTRRYAKALQREHLLYRGGVQRLLTMLASDLPNAVAMLDRVIAQIEAYIAAGPTLVTSESQASAGVFGDENPGNMKRAIDVAPEAETPNPSPGNTDVKKRPANSQTPTPNPE